MINNKNKLMSNKSKSKNLQSNKMTQYFLKDQGQ